MESEALEERWQTALGPDWRTALEPSQSLRHPSACETQQTLIDEPPAAGGAFAEPGFERLAELGRGGLGCVYRAHQSSLGRDVALKVLHPELANEPARQRDFLSEARVQGRLEHPNIIPVHELGRDPQGRCYLAMKLVRGQSWSAMLHAGRHDLRAQLEILLSVCNAVAFAHTRGIVHLDLKPSNVMVGDFGEVLVADWGLAAVLSGFPTGPGLRRVREICQPCGTPCYMAPELAEGAGEQVGTATDVYLLGGILYRLCTGQPPHHAQTLFQTVVRASQGRMPERLAELPAELRELCKQALQPKAASRLQDVTVFAQAIRAYLSHRESQRVADRAASQLQTCASLPAASTDPNQLYAGFAACLAGFEQAQSLWAENPQALEGALATRLSYAEAALQRGDLGLVETLLEQLAGCGEQRAVALRSGLRAAYDRRQSERRTRRLLWGGLLAASLMLAAAALLGLMNKAEREAWQLREHQARVTGLEQNLAALQPERLLWRAQQRVDAGMRQEGLDLLGQELIDSLSVAAVVSQRLDQLLAEEPSGLTAGDPLRSRLRLRSDQLRATAVVLALHGGEFGLARSLARPVADTAIAAELLVTIHRAENRELREQLSAVDAAVASLLEGTIRPARSSWLPFVDGMVVRLSSYRRAEVVAALAEHLRPFRERAAREARRGTPVPWTMPERAALGLIIDVLGFISLPEQTLPVLSAFLREIWDHGLIVRACSALCRDRRQQAYDFMIHELAPRLGLLSGTWRAVQDLLAEFAPKTLDPSHPDPRDWTLRGIAAVYQGELAQALSDFERALEIDPSDQLARMHQASTLMELGRAEEGLARWDKLLVDIPDDPDLFCNRGLARMRQGDSRGALRDFDAALGLDSLHVPARSNRGLVCIELDQPEQALIEFTQALQHDPLAGEVWLNRSGLRSRMGDSRGALEDLDRAALLLPLAPRIHVARAHLFLGLGRTQDAISSFEHAIATDPHFAVGWLGHGLAQLMLGDAVRALEDFDQALALDPDLYEAVDGRIRALEVLGRAGEARDDLDALLELRPDLLGPRILRARLQRRAGAVREALADTDEALRRHPRASVAYAERAACHLALGMFAEAQADCDAGLALWPDHALLLVRRGVLRKLRGEVQAAFVDFDAAIVSDPLVCEGYRERGMLRLDRQELPLAIADLGRAVELNPADASTGGLLAVALQQHGESARALAQIEKALQIRPEDANLVYVHAWLLVSMGRYPEATERYALLTRLRPAEASFWTDYGQLLHETGRPEAALEAFQSALECAPDDQSLMLNVAAALRGLGRLDDARQRLDAVLERWPDCATGFLQRAMVCAAQQGEGEQDLARAVALWGETPQMAFEAACAIASQLEPSAVMRGVQLDAATRLLRVALDGGVSAEALADPRLDNLRGHSGWPGDSN